MSNEQLTKLAHTQMPLTALLGLVVEWGGPEEVVATGEWRPEHCTAGGLIHGGYLMAQAESVGAICAFLNLPDGAATSTIESKTNFMRPVVSGFVPSGRPQFMWAGRSWSCRRMSSETMTSWSPAPPRPRR